MSIFFRSPADESEPSPLVTILRKSEDALVLAICNSSEELLSALVNCKDDESAQKKMKMVFIGALN